MTYMVIKNLSKTTQSQNPRLCINTTPDYDCKHLISHIESFYELVP